MRSPTKNEQAAAAFVAVISASAAELEATTAEFEAALKYSPAAVAQLYSAEGEGDEMVKGSDLGIKVAEIDENVELPADSVDLAYLENLGEIPPEIKKFISDLNANKGNHAQWLKENHPQAHAIISAEKPEMLKAVVGEVLLAFLVAAVVAGWVLKKGVKGGWGWAIRFLKFASAIKPLPGNTTLGLPPAPPNLYQDPPGDLCPLQQFSHSDKHLELTY